ncbi:hypothetical protein HanPSC8_Chr08g0307211 [Helianthus annuus]|nr:hypothetical protein HanPSC8_Chr08g0307211 [Helianthus annuus]
MWRSSGGDGGCGGGVEGRRQPWRRKMRTYVEGGSESGKRAAVWRRQWKKRRGRRCTCGRRDW